MLKPDGNRYVVPYGLSKDADGFRLKFPIWMRNRRGFDPVQDEFASGRWVLEVCIRTETSGIALRWGWRFSGPRHARPSPQLVSMTVAAERAWLMILIQVEKDRVACRRTLYE